LVWFWQDELNSNHRDTEGTEKYSGRRIRVIRLIRGFFRLWFRPQAGLGMTATGMRSLRNAVTLLRQKAGYAQGAIPSRNRTHPKTG
jgi:hypothetical protein